jgi:hypothetical protein
MTRSTITAGTAHTADPALYPSYSNARASSSLSRSIEGYNIESAVSAVSADSPQCSDTRIIAHQGTKQNGKVVTFENENGTFQSYELIGIHTSLAPGGEVRREAVWKTACAVCGATFTVTSKATQRAVTHRLQGLYATRCNKHRKIKRKKRGDM